MGRMEGDDMDADLVEPGSSPLFIIRQDMDRKHACRVPLLHCKPDEVDRRRQSFSSTWIDFEERHIRRKQIHCSGGGSEIKRRDRHTEGNSDDGRRSPNFPRLTLSNENLASAFPNM